MTDNLFMIVAITEKSRAIGKDGQMIYHLKDDLKYFKATTMGHTIVCGTKTYMSFPKRPLPGRKNIVLTRSDKTFEGAHTLHSKEEVLQYAKDHPEEEVYIVGGDNVYKQFIDQAKRLYITEIEQDGKVEADSFFPEFDKEDYNVIFRSPYIENDNAPRNRYLVYEKK